jgi:alanyl-tRNA synthetase
MMLFGEKYPDPVRMISMGDFSRELCGGTHLDRTSQIERVELLSEEGISAGTRRVTMLTGSKAEQFAENTMRIATALAQTLGCPVAEISHAVSELWQRVKTLRKQIESGARGGPGGGTPTTSAGMRASAVDYRTARSAVREAARQLNVGTAEVLGRVESLANEETALREQLRQAAQEQPLDADAILARAVDCGDFKLLVCEVPGANANTLRLLIDQIRKKTTRTAMLFASIVAADKIDLVAALTRDLVDSGLKAGDWVKAVAPIVGGGGGGKPDVAQAGGKHPEKIKQALEAAVDFMRTANIK